MPRHSASKHNSKTDFPDEKDIARERARHKGDRSFMPAFPEIQSPAHLGTEETNAGQPARDAAQWGDPVNPL